MQMRAATALPGMYAALALIAAAVTVSAQVSNAPQLTPVELVRAAINNEIAAGNNKGIKFMFHSRKLTQKGAEDWIYVEANEALAGMVIRENDRPLTPDREKAETDRIAALVNNPDQLRKKQKHETEQVEHTLRVLKALPDAFLYEFAGTENSEKGLGKPGDPLVKLTFTPNPSYSPPSHIEQVLEGMKGYVLIDPVARRLARIDCTLFKDVTFGWGIFGRLDQGGRFVVQQAEVGDGLWGITNMNLKLTGKILLLKTLNVISDEVFTDFQRLPDNVPFARGVELLQTEQFKLAQNLRESQSAESKRTLQ